jgi:hypothetical protein
MIDNEFKSLKFLLNDLRITPNQLLFLHVLTEKGQGGNKKASAITWYAEYLGRLGEIDFDVSPVTELDIRILIERGFISYIGSDPENADTNDFIISHDYEKYITAVYKKEEVKTFGLDLINRYPSFIKVKGDLYPSRSQIKVDHEGSVIRKLTKENTNKETITDTEFYEYYYTTIEGSKETHELLMEAIDYIKKQELHSKPKESFFSYGIVAFISSGRFRSAIDIYQSLMQSTNSFINFDKVQPDFDQI